HGESSVRVAVHGVPCLFSKCVLEIETGIVGTVALAKLGASDDESDWLAGWQSALERARLSIRRGIPAPCRAQFEQPHTPSRRETARGIFKRQTRKQQGTCDKLRAVPAATTSPIREIRVSCD